MGVVLALMIFCAVVAFATLPIPLSVMGYDVSWLSPVATVGGHLYVVVAGLAVAALFVIVFLALMKRTGEVRSGNAGGHISRRITQDEPADTGRESAMLGLLAILMSTASGGNTTAPLDRHRSRSLRLTGGVID